MDKLDKKIRQVKLARMKPVEKYLYEIFSNLNVYKFNDTIYYKNNNKIILEYNNIDRILWCYTDVWKKLKSNFDIAYHEIKKIIEHWVVIFISSIQIRDLMFL